MIEVFQTKLEHLKNLKTLEEIPLSARLANALGLFKESASSYKQNNNLMLVGEMLEHFIAFALSIEVEAEKRENRIANLESSNPHLAGVAADYKKSYLSTKSTLKSVNAEFRTARQKLACLETDDAVDKNRLDELERVNFALTARVHKLENLLASRAQEIGKEVAAQSEIEKQQDNIRHLSEQRRQLKTELETNDHS